MPRGETRPLSTVFELFAEDIKRYEYRVRRAVKVPVTQTQFDALVSFDFNTGGIHRAKLTKKLNEGDIAGAAAAFDGWRRPPEIVPRRNAEKALFRDGTYSHNGMATAYPADREGRVQWAKGERINVLQLLDTPPIPDDPGPTPEPDNEDVESAWNDSRDSRARGNGIRLLGGLFIGAALYALREPIKGLFGWLANGNTAQKIISTSLLIIALGAFVYSLLGDF